MSASGPETAATTRLVSASFPLTASLMQIVNGCCQPNMVALVVSKSSQALSSKSRTLRLVLASHPKVTCLQPSPNQYLIPILYIAISRRMATDKGGQQGPRSTRDPPSNPNPAPQQQRYRQPERTDNHDNNTIGVAPAVPGFGFQFPGMPNGFQFPPGFIMPGTTPAQPPPPGAS